MISFHLRFFKFGETFGEKGFDWCKTWHVSKNKSFEVQTTFWGASEMFSLDVDTHFWGEDHAGPEFRIEIMGLYLGVKLYDRRHWNYDEGRFQTEAEAKAEAEEWAAESAEREAKRQAHIAVFDELFAPDHSYPVQPVRDAQGNELIPAGYFKAK